MWMGHVILDKRNAQRSMTYSADRNDTRTCTHPRIHHPVCYVYTHVHAHTRAHNMCTHARTCTHNTCAHMHTLHPTTCAYQQVMRAPVHTRAQQRDQLITSVHLYPLHTHLRSGCGCIIHITHTSVCAHTPWVVCTSSATCAPHCAHTRVHSACNE